MEKIYQVAEITTNIKYLLESNYSFLQVQGEISGLTQSSRGHLYFRLKDERAQISCVYFRFLGKKLDLKLEDGIEVIVSGRISVYELQGNYQMILEKIEPIGIGALQIRLEELKKKLQQQGYFDLNKKKNIPSSLQKVGIVTSLQAAALQDILKILKRRSPQIEIVIANSLVQGNSASQNLIMAIEALEKKGVDLILITRGGGSIEDLWCFNDEQLAKRIFVCSLPIVSAVGHESDFTICDLVADKRAATPSEAAEMISSDNEELLEKIQNFKNILYNTINSKIIFFSQKIENLSAQLNNPIYKVQNYLQQIDYLNEKMISSWKEKFQQKKKIVVEAKNIILQSPVLKSISFLSNEINIKKQSIQNSITHLIQQKQKELLTWENQLKREDPIQPLNKGYARVSHSKGMRIKNIQQIQSQDMLKVEFKDGEVLTQVEQVIKKLL